ncbi:MAG: hypothetical protein HYY04_02745 [Chloroflexi bacterium]|nr:hypothetical protein [Chloroflexota bacterium]
MTERKSSSGSGTKIVFFGLFFIVGPIVAQAAGYRIPVESQALLMLFGVVLLILGSIVLTVTRLYHKTAADRALVRTGMGGPRAIIDGGALVIPVVHELIPVSLQTMRLDVERSAANALITGDNLRADVEAEFYIKVQKRSEDVIAAGTSLGERSVDAESVKHLVFQKLVSALRTVAATRSLNELHTKRDDFASAVQQIVERDLAHNGLTLETVTISKLDQTPPTAMRGEDNVFDAQGLRTIAEITNQQRIRRNEIEREADQRVKEQDVARDQFLFQQDVVRSRAEATRDRDIQTARAEAAREAKTFAAEQERQVGLAQVEQQRAVQIAEVERERALKVAMQQREQAADIAARDREIAVAMKERERAEAEAQRFSAETRMEADRQAVTMVQTTQAAEREKARAVIEAQAGIERTRLQEQMGADVAAYRMVRSAEAEQTAAAKQAEARRTLAQAEKEAKTLEAEGERAAQLVPVDVERQRVEVERARVDVRREDLRNQSEFETIARELQVDLARIEAEREVRIETARALGAAVASAKMTVWGSPETVTRLTEAFFRGQQGSAVLDGLLAGASPETRQTLAGIGQLLAPLIASATGKPADPQAIEEALAKIDGSSGSN